MGCYSSTINVSLLGLVSKIRLFFTYILHLFAPYTILLISSLCLEPNEKKARYLKIYIYKINFKQECLISQRLVP